MICKRAAYIITIFFLAALQMHAQDPINYTVKNGLPTNHIYDVQEDKNGFMWFATNRGLVKFNGNNFKTLTLKEGLPNNDIFELYLDTKKRLWFFSKSKRQGYILNDSIYSFSAEDNETINPRIIYEIDSTLWIGGGTYKFAETYFERQTKIDSAYRKIYAAVENKFSLDIANTCCLYNFIENKFIVITQNGLLFVNDALHIKKHINLTTLKNTDVRITSFFRRDNIWVLMNKTGAIVVNSANESAKHLVFKSFASNYSSSIGPKCVFTENTYQISFPNYLLIFDKHFELLKKHRFPEHLEINNAFKDSQGNIWAYNFNKGVFLYSAAQLQSTYYLKGKKMSVLGRAKDLFLTASETDLEYKFVAETDSFTPIYIAPKNFTPYKIYTYKDKGYLVFQGGIYQYNNTFKKLENTSNDNVNLGGKDFLIKQDTTFLLTGYSIIIKASNYNKNISEQGLLEVENFNNTIYVGGSDGLLQLKKENLVATNIKDTLLNTPIIELKSTLKNLWVGTDGRGIYSYTNSGVQHIKATDNLSVQTIIPDADTLWLATNKGIKKVVLKTPVSESIIANSFYENDGLLQNNVNTIFLKDHQIFVATDIGISKIDPNSTIYKKSLRLYFENTSDTLVVEQNDNRNISISFNTLSYGNQEHLEYKYRLLPQEKKWIATQTNVLNFSNLSPNVYTLQVSVTDQHRNAAQKSLVIKVLPKWWETTIAKILFLITGIGLLSLLVLYIIKYYKTKEQKQQEALQRMKKLELQALRSQMNPHFVHNSLNAIQYYIQRHEVELSENYLSKFSKLIRLFFEYSRRQTISIEEEIKLLKNYLEIEKLRFEDKISYHINIDPKLDIEERFMPTMILQPIVENAVNHGLFHKKDNGLIFITFNYISRYTFEVSVKDDGVGIIKAKEFYKKSSKNYQSRSSAVLEERLKLLKESKEWDINFEIKDLSAVNPQTTGTLVNLVITQPIIPDK